MGRANIGRANSYPSRIEPERGKVGEDVGKCKRNVPCDVFKDCVSGSKNAKGVGDVGPDMSLIGCTCALSCV